MESLDGAERLEAITAVQRETGERRRLAVGGLVVKVGHVPNTEPFRVPVPEGAPGAGRGRPFSLAQPRPAACRHCRGV